MKYKCVKSVCEVCGKVSTIQLFFRSIGELAYGRARHYLGKKEDKPQFEISSSKHRDSENFIKNTIYLCDY